MKFWVLILLIILSTGVCFSDTPAQNPAQPLPSITTPQNIKFENCSKMFAVNKDKLFYLTLGSITANKFTIDEIQTENGYIIFTSVRFLSSSNLYSTGVGSSE